MNFLTSPGFLFAGCSCATKYKILRPPSDKPRLVLWTVLCEFEESMNVMGPNCNSWGLPARSTSQRNYMNPNGATHLPFVDDGNCCVSRILGPIYQNKSNPLKNG